MKIKELPMDQKTTITLLLNSSVPAYIHLL